MIPVGKVRDPYRRIGRVHRLAARAGRAVHVDPEVLRVDLDLLVRGVLEQRDHVEAREGGVPALLRVERRDPDEPVDASLRRHQAVRVRPVDDERRALDARLVAEQHLVDLDVEPLAFGPPQVHPQEHLGPVLRLGAAGARVQRRDRVVVVVLAAEQRRELELLDVAFELADSAREVGAHLPVGLVREELVHRARVLEASDEAVVPVDLGAQPRERRGQLLAACGVVPERRVGRLAFELGRACALAVDVKGTPSRRRSAS